MELKDFVVKILTDLDSAVDEARKATSRDISFTSNQDKRTVEFDIAVTAEQGSSAGGKAGVKVLSFVEGGGEIKKTNKNQTVSRVQFGLHVDSWTKQENQQQAVASAGQGFQDF